MLTTIYHKLHDNTVKNAKVGITRNIYDLTVRGGE